MKLNRIVIVAIVFALSFTGGQFTASGMDWYKTIRLPSWTPPGSVIGIVWTVIYILTAISAMIVWNGFPRGKAFNIVAGLFILNAGFNLAWSCIFFYYRMIGAALIDSLAIEVTLLILIPLIWKQSKVASWLLTPYALWVGFATYLNYTIFVLNRV